MMNLDDSLRKFHDFIHSDHKLVDTDPPTSDIRTFEHYVNYYHWLERDMKEHYPLVYGTSVIHQQDPESFKRFRKLDKSLIQGKKKIRNTLANWIDRGDDLEACVSLAETIGDLSSYHLAKQKLSADSSEEAIIMNNLEQFLDDDFLDLEKEFYENSWSTSSIKELEKLREESGNLVEKGRYLEDSELVYRGAELKDQMDSVLDRLKSKRSRSRKAKAGLAASIVLTAWFLFQPYIPPEKITQTYKEITGSIKSLFENNISNASNPESYEAVQQSIEED